MSGTALRLENISKSFDGHPALSGASLQVNWGELHALLGENGAGKSTLMNIVCGLYTADGGSTVVNDSDVSINGPTDATRYGIGMVHQHFKLVGPFTVAENVLLSCGKKLKTSSLVEAARLAREAAQKIGFDINTDARVDDLSIAERQRVEIVKLILLGADILILDEPTAVLTDEEAETVLSLLRDLAAQGKAVVLITHRLREVVGFADRVTIMRGGETVRAAEKANTLGESDLAQAMVGETLTDNQHTNVLHKDANATVRLEIKNLSVKREDKTLAINDLSLQMRTGEIFGVAGVGGNGQTELAEAIYGLAEIDDGSISMDAEDLSGLSILQRRRSGLRVVPADRFAYSLLADFKAYENLGITEVPNGRFGSSGWLSRNKMKSDAKTAFKKHDILGGTPNTRTRLFSGGNAQKLLLARELDEHANVLIAHSPTRGLDVRAYQAVHEFILASVKNGAACLLISEDLDEVLKLSTRIAVLTRGQLLGPYSTQEISRAKVGELMAGHA